MTYTYTWANAEKTSLKRKDEKGNVAFVPVAEDNRDYREFVSSGATAKKYVAPKPPAPLTAEEKLQASGLTVEELKGLLGL